MRPMRRAAGAEEGDGGLRQLRSVLLLGGDGEMHQNGGTGMASGGGTKGEALLLLLGEEDTAGAELLPAPLEGGGAGESGEGEEEEPMDDLRALRLAVQRAMREAREGFSFKGFGLTFTKSLTRKDFGIGTKNANTEGMLISCVYAPLKHFPSFLHTHHKQHRVWHPPHPKLSRLREDWVPTYHQQLRRRLLALHHLGLVRDMIDDIPSPSLGTWPRSRRPSIHPSIRPSSIHPCIHLKHRFP